MTTTKKAAAKTASKPTESKAKTDPRPLLQEWHRAQQHIDAIDAQTGANAVLPARDAQRLHADRADHLAAQKVVEDALA